MSALFVGQATRFGGRPAMRMLVSGGAAADERLTWRDWLSASRAFASALVDAGHMPGDAVAIWAGNDFTWPVADLGVLMAAGVSVGIYPTAAPVQVRDVLLDSGTTILTVDDPSRLETVIEHLAELPKLRRIVARDGRADGDRITTWDAFMARGTTAIANGDGAIIDRRIERARPDDIAALMYTSGSTGESRGARISHRYLLASVESLREVLGFDDTDTSLSFLPFSHAAERITGLYTRIACGIEGGIVADHHRLFEAAADYEPTFFGGLPRFWERALEAIDARRETLGPVARERWDRAHELGIRRSRLLQTGIEVDAILESRWRDEASPLFDAVRNVLGGRIRIATSGGAGLPVAVAESLDAFGITILGAYGLTEHLCVAFHRPGSHGFDSAGPPMPGTDIRIAEDGEILVRRGPLTFTGYHGDDAATRAAFTEDGGWLLTGDLGEITALGELRVTGRKKELIVLSSGKMIAPAPIEAALAEDPLIAQAVLHGDGRGHIVALIALRDGRARDRASEVDATNDVHARVRAAIERVNARLSNPERIRAYALLVRELSLEAGELTPTQKVRRAVVAERYRDVIDELYRRNA
jgi:long-chain acyl-CoA synthetase